MSAAADILERYGWWSSLKHGGLLIAPSKLAEHFEPRVPPLPRYQAERLRRAVLGALDRNDVAPLLDTALEDILGLGRPQWLKASAVGPEWTRHDLTRNPVKPRRVWQGPGAVLPVFSVDAKEAPRLGVGRGRRAAARVVEWLRQRDEKLALLTNGRYWRLIHAGPDYEAWCEWDIDLWFEEGQPGPQVDALRHLLQPDALAPAREGATPRLLAAILASRKGQAELSSALGERVRQAVEELIRSCAGVTRLVDEDQAAPRDIYIAATRLVMRCVVILFAEARELLPRDNPVYEDSYGIQGLRTLLDRIAGGHGGPDEGRSRLTRLHHSHWAWPRLLALFRLVYRGSPHPDLTLQAYGGGLFEPGDSVSPDPVLRALAAFEDPANCPADAAVYRILRLITYSQVKVRQANRNVQVTAPVDFSDLSTEYIGILYEGLLDYELRRQDETFLFLSIGDQPALPFSRLQAMSGKELANLFEKLKKSNEKLKASGGEEEGGEAEEPEELAEPEGEEAAEAPEPDEDAEAESAGAPPEAEEPETDDRRRQVLLAAEDWARRAVEAAKLVNKPRSRKKEALARYEEDVRATAKKLIQRTVMPGEWFLIRWGGTRKGSGTFYTRPLLAAPTVRRTLRPLAYEPVREETDSRTGLSHVTEWRPKKPEEILELKVCDPAMGSGSFLISALRFLTQALAESLHFHGRIERKADGAACRLADGLPASAAEDETLPVPPDHDEFEALLQARLQRHVVERCIYGVDLDPMAVELARMALWITTMNRDLPFGFLDHKLKCGDSLIGCWFDRFLDYPVMAWEREGGDKNHDGFVHHYRETRGRSKKGDKWTAAIREKKNGIVKNELRERILLLSKGEKDVQTSLAFQTEGFTEADVHDEALRVLEKLHALPVHETDERKRLYEELRQNPDYQRLREAFDLWCALWFWPADEIESAPLPGNYLSPPEETRARVRELRGVWRFFHWELEFPDVFSGERTGFHAVAGNPPWEIQKPNSKEFFSNIDPLYRGYGKQEALSKQKQYFEEEPEAEARWLAYCAGLKALSNWTKFAGHPFGDRVTRDSQGRPRHDFPLGTGRRGFEDSRFHHELWQKARAGRKSYAGPEHPFLWQGSADINTYKLHLENARALLAEGGRLGFLVPSGVYTDKGSTELRELLLARSRWEWLFGFENREKVFDIDSRFKFGPVIAQKGGETQAIRAAFMHRDLEDWDNAERHVLAYPREQVEQFSPRSKAILEIRDQRDLDVLEKLYANGVLLGDEGPEGWGIRYATEFHMTNDSKLFPPRPKWEEKGYRPDEYSHWLKGRWKPYGGPRSILKRPKGLILSRDGAAAIHIDDVEDAALPLYEGRMIGQFDFSEKGWVRGRGRSAEWREILFEAKVVEPQYLMKLQTAVTNHMLTGLKAPIMNIASATNARSVICSVISNAPCNHALNPIRVGVRGFPPNTALLGFCGFANSFAFDCVVRSRLGGLNLSFFVLDEVALPKPSGSPQELFLHLAHLVSKLSMPSERFAKAWAEVKSIVATDEAWKSRWCLTGYERLRTKVVADALVAQLYGLDVEHLSWIVRDCDHPRDWINSRDSLRTLDPKGFWRVDKDKDPELRHTVLAQVAFQDLKRMGLKAFLEQNDGEGWMLPEKLRLADYGLGHDARAKAPQPVAPLLGPRFLPWQLEQSVEESWEECERHAELIARIVPPPSAPAQAAPSASAPKNLLGEPVPVDLFGNPVYPKTRRRK